MPLHVHPSVRLAGRAHELGLLDPRRALQLRVLASEVEDLGLSIRPGLLLERTGWIESDALAALREETGEALWRAPRLDPEDRTVVEQALACRRSALGGALADRLDRAAERLAKLGLAFEDWEILASMGALDPAALERFRERSRRAAPDYEAELARFAARGADRAPIRATRPRRRRAALAAACLAAASVAGAFTALRGSRRIDPPPAPVSPERPRPGVPAVAREAPRSPDVGRSAARPARLGSFGERVAAPAADRPDAIAVASAAWTAPGVSAAAGTSDGSAVRVVVHGPWPDGAWLAIRLLRNGDRLDESRAVVAGGRVDHALAAADRFPPGELDLEVEFHPAAQHAALVGRADLPAGVVARLSVRVPPTGDRELLESIAAIRERLDAAAAEARRTRAPLGEWATRLDRLLDELERLGRSAGPPAAGTARALEVLARAESVAIHRERYAKPRPEDEVAGAGAGPAACRSAYEASARDLAAWIEGRDP